MKTILLLTHIVWGDETLSSKSIFGIVLSVKNESQNAFDLGVHHFDFILFVLVLTGGDGARDFGVGMTTHVDFVIGIPNFSGESKSGYNPPLLYLSGAEGIIIAEDFEDAEGRVSGDPDEKSGFLNVV